MRRRSVVLLSAAVAVALFLGWASAMAQMDDQLPVVDWPCESRFVTSVSPDQEIVQVAWPCEARFIALKPVAADESTMVARVDWPSEARFVATAEEYVAAIDERWPSEARFIALVPIMPDESLAQVVLWPSEARYLDGTGYARLVPADMPDTVTANKQVYREVVEAFFTAGNAEPLYSHYPQALAQVRMDEWVGWQHAFDDLDAHLDFQIAEGDRVLSCWTFTGVHNGEFMGIDATHKPITFQVLYTARLINGMVVEEIGELELQPLLEQLDVDLVPRAL